MMSAKNIIRFLIVLFIGVYNQDVYAQGLNITGDTIFVNAEAEIQINFPTLPKSFSTVPNNAPYNLKSVGTGVNIIARFENSRPATLLVSEADRNHRFIIVFKKDINYSNDAELFYDYSTEKKLQQHLRGPISPKPAPPEKVIAAKTPIVEPTNNSSNYYTLLEQGEKDFNQQKYLAAKESFEKAHLLRPDDIVPVQRLEDIKLKLNPPKEKAVVQSPNDKNYSIIIAGAINYLSQKRYKEAKEAYKQALDQRPGDLYAMHQMETIDKLLQEADGQKDQQKLKDLYNDYISQGEKAFGKNQWAEARVAFEQALVIKQNDVLATKRLKVIEEKEKVQKESDDLENSYKTAIQSADKFFQEGDYANAKADYIKASGFIKRAYPQDQVKKIDALLAEQILKENSDRQKQAQQALTDRQAKEKQALEDNYDAAVQMADSYYKKGDYDNAKIEYNKALDFIKKDWPKEQINTINKIITEQAAQQNLEKQARLKQEVEDRYNAAMQAADKFFNAGDYVNAKEEYNKAMSIIPKPLPQEQIKKINKLIADQLAQANAERQRLALEAEITSKYSAIIKNADVEFDKANYIKAKKFYTDASKLKTAEEYPKERLLTIETLFAKIASDLKAKNDSIALAAETNKKYNLAVLKAKSYYEKTDLVNAKTFYEEAAMLKPSEDEPKKQLNIITNQLAELAKMAEIDSNYESKIVLADSLLNAKAYESALVSYNDALGVKSSESYPKMQIKYIRSEIIENEKLREIARRQEDERRYRDVLASAEKAVPDKRYRDAKSAYIEALAIHPTNQYAQDRLRIVSNQIQLARADKLKLLSANKLVPPQPEVKSKKPTKKDKKNKVVVVNDKPVLQSNPLPYSKEELKSKYPNIDFSAFPPEQPFNKSWIYSKENLTAFDEMLSEEPRLDSSASDQGIKLICQGINFGETIVYVKLLIQNTSTTDFLTGPMMFTWTRKAGNVIRLYPYRLYPSPLPVIKPGNEAYVVYVCKSYDILDEETMGFELTDRLNKIKLHVSIPGSVYNREWAR